MDATFTPGIPNDPAKAQDRFKKMQEATARLGTSVSSVDLTEEGVNIADIVRSVKTNYGSKRITEDLRPGPADPSMGKNKKPMKCSKCQYHGEPANDGKCKECGAAMVPMMTSNEAFPPKPDNGGAPLPPPDGGVVPDAGGAPAMPPPGSPGGPMPLGPPDDGKDDDFDPSDVVSPEVGEMVAYAVEPARPGYPIRARAGRVLLVFRGEASIDTGRKDTKGKTIVDKAHVSTLSRVPESLLTTTTPTNGRVVDYRDPEVHRAAPAVESRTKSKAQKLIEQVANGRRTADEAVEALLS